MADSTLPHRPKPEESSAAAPATENAPAAEGGAAPPSKAALKKAAKEKAKAEKAAALAAQEEARKAALAASDTAVGLYGKLPETEDFVSALDFLQLGDEHYEKEVTVVGRVDTTRSQSAKLGFLTLRQKGKKLQTVIAAPPEGPVSRLMVKWVTGLNVNSIVQVTGVAKKPAVPIASATLTELELHITKIYLVAGAAEMIPMQVKDAERPPPLTDGIEGEPELDAEGAPIVTLKTRLDNRVLDLQTETSQAITWISSGVAQLFTEYMLKSGARWIFSSKLNGSSTEGGSEVFEVKYFKKKAFLAQSPQLHKQICIAGDMDSVFEVGPVFRAEESNTHRHLTEVINMKTSVPFSTLYRLLIELIVYWS
jgi:aspartyl-tRNA synthetase